MVKLEALDDAESLALIHAINAAAHPFLGANTPDPETCQIMARILKTKFPDTYASKECVMTQYGPLALKGKAVLEKRLHNNYYNKIVRKLNGSPKNLVFNKNCILNRKKSRKVYGLSKNKWNMCSSASSIEIQRSKEKFNQLEHGTGFEEKSVFMEDGALYIQKIFSTEEPHQIVEDLSGFFEGGPKLLQSWINFMCDDDLDLISKADEQTRKISNLLESYLMEKKEESYEQKLLEFKKSSLARYGTESAYVLFLIREAALIFKDKPELVFVKDGENVQINAEKNTPNILMLERRSKDRNNEFEYDFVLKVRIGEKV